MRLACELRAVWLQADHCPAAGRGLGGQPQAGGAHLAAGGAQDAVAATEDEAACGSLTGLACGRDHLSQFTSRPTSEGRSDYQHERILQGGYKLRLTTCL